MYGCVLAYISASTRARDLKFVGAIVPFDVQRLCLVFSIIDSSSECPLASTVLFFKGRAYDQTVHYTMCSTVTARHVISMTTTRRGGLIVQQTV